MAKNLTQLTEKEALKFAKIVKWREQRLGHYQAEIDGVKLYISQLEQGSYLFGINYKNENLFGKESSEGIAKKVYDIAEEQIKGKTEAKRKYLQNARDILKKN